MLTTRIPAGLKAEITRIANRQGMTAHHWATLAISHYCKPAVAPKLVAPQPCDVTYHLNPGPDVERAVHCRAVESQVSIDKWIYKTLLHAAKENK